MNPTEIACKRLAKYVKYGTLQPDHGFYGSNLWYKVNTVVKVEIVDGLGC